MDLHVCLVRNELTEKVNELGTRHGKSNHSAVVYCSLLFLSNQFFSYVVMACIVAGVGAIDGLHFRPPKVPVTHRFPAILQTQEQHNLHGRTNA
jgi:hypothetical protein